ncbi:MAG: hypothetical protein FWF02_07210 [Micrococcales bacterium]|nr:hypothetical protein [Micrococcales bacterium]MCL2667480.1 hypothetical protein [Micrococcales bacterium]
MSTPAQPAWRSAVSRFVIPLGAMVIAFAAGWTVGAGRASDNTPTTGWTDATVTVTGTQAKVKADGSTFEFGQSVPGWLDKDGKWQENTWPACLADGFSGTVPVLVSTTVVDSTSITAVVAVNCRK